MLHFKLFLFLLLSTLLLAEKMPFELKIKPLMSRSKTWTNFSSNLPLVILSVPNDRIHTHYDVNAQMSIISPDDNNRSHFGLKPTHQTWVAIQKRGTSSLQYPKKQYVFSTQDALGNNKGMALLGMPKDHKWILQAPYSDKTLMRNYLAYEKTREINPDKYYAVRSKFVEVFQDMGDYYHYDGVYLLMEKIKRDKQRLNIKKTKLSQGYIFKLDRNVTAKSALMFKENKQFVYVYPSEDEIRPLQRTFLSSYLQAFQKALYSEDFNQTSSYDYYGRWIDIDSFIVHFLSREFFLDADIWMFSEYLHKDSAQKLFLSAVWDFNLGMGNDNYRFQGNYEQFAYKHKVAGHPYTLSSWLRRLMSDPSFEAKVKARWKALREGIWSDKALMGFIDETKEKLDESAERNFKRWKRVMGRFVWPNRKTCTENGKRIYCKTFESAVENDLKAWLLLRAKWIDGQFLDRPSTEEEALKKN